MKKLLFLLICLNSVYPFQAGESTELIKPTPKTLRYGRNVMQLAFSTFLFVGGSWLAHRQLPRLAGQQVEYNAPVFTKVFASGLFMVGVVGGVVGAYKLGRWVQKNFDDEHYA